LLALGAVWLATAPAGFAQGRPVTFSVIGDIPYDQTAADRFRAFVAEHDRASPSDFFVHVGDIKAQSGQCLEPDYLQASDILGELAVPSFVLPGDNEWNDCSDPGAAWLLWEAYFSGFEQRYCGTPLVESQAARPENFAFVHERVLFVGLNLVGGTVHDAAEWDLRMHQDAEWVEQQFAEKGGQVRAAVVFGHAARDGSRSVFFDRFDAAALAFARPVLFIHGDGHSWIHETGWEVPNVERIQIEQNDPPLQVTVTLGAETPFVLERDPWPAGTPALDRPPCADAGPDRVVALGEGAALDGRVADDGEPAPGALVASWSQVSGPGEAAVADPASPATSADFPEPGAYVLRLTADDGASTASDDVEVYVDAGEPSLWIRDATVVEGSAGAPGIAAFEVELRSATGAPVSVDYMTADGTALAGSDYLGTSGSLAFSGATVAQTVMVPVLGDGGLEDFESFRVVLDGASGAAVADASATGLILDDDVPRPPAVTSFSPATGPRGSVVRVTGQFADVIAVALAGVPAEFSVLSDTELDLVVPPTARSGPISVANPGGVGQSQAAFGVEFPLPVQVIGSGSVSRSPAGPLYPEGQTVTLTPLPASGWEFLVWGGALVGVGAPAAIRIADETSVTATFVEAGSVSRIQHGSPVASANDDAEENVEDGGVDLASGDLELAVDGAVIQIVGLRFADLGIARGARILSANVQFTVDQTSSGPAALSIRGEAADDAAAFRNAARDVSGRAPTSAAVAWSPPEWTKRGEAGAAQRTPDLSAVVQEIVDRPGWVPGNALVLALSGTGTRTAEAYEGGASLAARLDVVEVVDLAAPEAPANLRASDWSETRIDLAWDAPYDNLGVIGYRLYRLGGPVDVSGTSHSETGLAPGRLYGFQVSALDAAGNESAPSPLLLVRTRPWDREPPTVPRNLRSPVQTATSVELAWDAASDDVGVIGYRVYGTNGVAEVPGTSFTVDGLASGRTWAFQVSALDAAGNESMPTPLLVVRTRAVDLVPPTAPQDLRSPAQSWTSVELVWEASTDDLGVVAYRVYGPAGVVEVPGTGFTVDGLAPGRIYAFQVTALDAAGNESMPTPLLVVATPAPDRERPTAPPNLRSPAQTWTSVELAWDASTDDLGVIGYRVYGTNGVAEVPGTGYTAGGLAPGRTYAFQVTARDAAGNESMPSAMLSVRTPSPDLEPPTAPQNLRARKRTTTSFELAWDPATDNVGVIGYRVYGADGVAEVSGTTYVATGLEPATAYGFQVTAVDAAGNESRPTSLLTPTRRLDVTPPTAPQDLRSPEQTTTSIELAWDPATDDVGVIGYRVYRHGGPIDVAGTSYTETGLLPDREYGFQVAAFDAAGNESEPSPVLRVRTRVPDLPPTTPGNLRSPAQTATSIDLAWDAAVDDFGVAGYRVYGPSGAVEVSGTTYTETGLAPDTEYAFQVSALDTAGQESARSPELRVRTRLPDLPPTTPGNLRSPAQTATSIDLAWDAAVDDFGVAGYRVYGPSGAVEVSGTTYTETGLEPLTEYDFQVSAFDAAGNESAPSPVLRVSTLGEVPRSFSAAVASGLDDAEEDLATGGVDVTSGDLELGLAGTTLQAVGLRFSGVGIPQGATIVSASVQFTADEVSTGAAALIVRGEAADDAAPFSTAAGDVSGRAATAASAAWSPPDWTSVGEAGAAQRTPDLSAVVQEIVARPGWAPGNALVLVVSGSGTRAAESYDAVPSATARLDVVYLSAPDRQAPSTPGNLRSPEQGASRIDLAWDAATDDFGVAGYRVYGPSGVVEVSGTTYTETGLEPLTEYDFQVSAFDAAGNESAPSPVLRVSTTATETLSLAVASGVEDVEENLATGGVNRTSGDLELGLAGTTLQAVGLRFSGVGIPQGATIVSASVQFTADEADAGAAALMVRGEAADDAAPFSTAAGDVSGRAATAASAAWSPPDWTLVGEAGAAQRTPDLSAVVQEIVARPGWAPGNALVLVVSGSGTRIAEAYDGAPNAAPVLRVEYRVDSGGPP
jgi:chitodextrinase